MGFEPNSLLDGGSYVIDHCRLHHAIPPFSNCILPFPNPKGCPCPFRRVVFQFLRTIPIIFHFPSPPNYSVSCSCSCSSPAVPFPSMPPTTSSTVPTRLKGCPLPISSCVPSALSTPLRPTNSASRTARGPVCRWPIQSINYRQIK